MVSLNKDNPLLDKHQQEAFEKLSSESGGIVWMRVGEGKTRIALIAAQQIACSDGFPLIIIIARRAAFYDWRQEIATLQMRGRIFEQDLIPFDELHTELTTKTLYHPSFLLISDGMIISHATQEYLFELHMARMIGTIIVDELWLFKNPQSKKHKALIQHTHHHPTIGISGSIMTARDVVDIYGQVNAVGRGKVLAPTLTKFRQAFQIGISGQYLSWYPKEGAYKAIMDKIAPFTYLYFPKTQMRQSKEIVLKVDATKQQVEYFKELKETAAIDGMFELTNMANLVTKAQQISNGWLKGESGDVSYFKSPKVDRTVAWVEEVLEEDIINKVVIWCAFREDITRLKHALEMSSMLRALSKIATLQSGTDFDTTLWKRSDCRICLATEASGTSINHFAQVPYGLYFSQDFKWTSLQQSKGRHLRRSSLHDTAYFTFIHTVGSLDAQVFYTVRTAASSEQSFINKMDVIQWLKGK